MSKAQLERGYRLVELLKQPLNSPMPVDEQVAVIFAGTRGHLDDIPVAEVRRFEAEFLDNVQREHAGIYDAIRETGALSEDTTTALKDAVEEFRRGFETSTGELLVKDEPAEPMEESEIVPEAVTRAVPKVKK